MRVRIGGHDVEGTAEEVAELLRMVGAQNAPLQVPLPPAERGASPFVTEDFAVSVLTRRPLGDAHVQVLNLLDSAGDKWTAAPDLQRELGLTTREFAGVLGAFGKRVAGTEGAGSKSFFDQYWDSDSGHNLYRLPPAVRSALRKANVVS